MGAHTLLGLPTAGAMTAVRFAVDDGATSASVVRLTRTLSTYFPGQPSLPLPDANLARRQKRPARPAAGQGLRLRSR